MFVSHEGMNDRGSMCKFRNARRDFLKFTRGSSVFHNSMRNKQVEFNPYIYNLSKFFCFGYEISVFKYITGRYSEQPLEQPAHTSRQLLHGKMDVKIFSNVHRSRKHLNCKYYVMRTVPLPEQCLLKESHHTVFMPPLEKEGHISSHMLIDMWVSHNFCNL